MSRDVLALALLCALTFFAGLGRPAIADSDEAFYAEAAREMVESGDWLTPHYNYEFRFQKPILFYWFIAATYLVTGVSEAAARFPSALAGLVIVVVTYTAASRWYGRRIGLISGAVAATSFGAFFMARQSLPDLPLASFVTIAVWATLTALDASDSTSRRRWVAIAGAATAAAFLTKGPVGLALPVIVLLPIVLRERREPSHPNPLPRCAKAERGSGVPASRAPRGVQGAPRPREAEREREARVRGRLWLGFRAGEIALAVIVLIVLAAPWYLAMTTRHGVWYLQHFFIGENVERFATDRFNEPRALWFYLPILMGGLLPWSPVLLLALPAALRVLRRQRRLSQVEWRLLIWTAAPLIFFSMSIGKQPRYVLPMLPPLAIVVAVIAGSPRTRGAARLARVPMAMALGGLALMILAQSLYRATPLLEVAGSTWIGPAALLIGLSGALVMAMAGVRPRWAPAALAVASAVSLAVLHYTAMSTGAPEPVERMAALVRETARPGDRPATHRVFVRNLIFYTRMKQVDLPTIESVAQFLPSGEASLLVIGAGDLQLLEVAAPHGLQRAGEVAYFNVANAKLRMLLSPDPQQDVERVLLLSRPQP